MRERPESVTAGNEAPGVDDWDMSIAVIRIRGRGESKCESKLETNGRFGESVG